MAHRPVEPGIAAASPAARCLRRGRPAPGDRHSAAALPAGRRCARACPAGRAAAPRGRKSPRGRNPDNRRAPCRRMPPRHVRRSRRRRAPARCRRRRQRRRLCHPSSVLSVFTRLAMTERRFRGRTRLRAAIFPAAPAQRRGDAPVRRPGRARASGELLARIAAVERAALGAEILQRLDQSFGAGLRPRAAQHRQLQRGDGARHAHFRAAPSRSSGCLSSASSVTGARPPSAASAASRAKTPAGVSGSASPPESSTAHIPARQRRQHAARQRAVGRGQRRGHARRLHRFAQRDGDGERFFFGIGGFDHADRGQRRVRLLREIRRHQSFLPKLRCRGRAQGFRDNALAPMRRGIGQDRHRVARDADALEQAVHGELRMAGGRRKILLGVAADHVPGVRRRDRCRARATPSRLAAGSAMVASNSAVAGIEPVEPAAMTGPLPRASRSASALISRSRRAAGSILPCSCRMPASASRAIFRKSQRELPVDCRPRAAQERRAVSNGTCRVVRSSISRARSSASASAAAGLLAISGASSFLAGRDGLAPIS